MMLYVIALIVLSSFLCFLHIQALFEFKENTQDFYFYFLFFFWAGGVPYYPILSMPSSVVHSDHTS